MRFFLAGIMQGSHPGTDLHEQDYRGRLRKLIETYFPQAKVYDPLADHSNSIEYDDRTGREVFYHHNRMCRQVDVVVAFVPAASMGTAIEMWEAHEHGRAAVIAISPLEHNWAIRFCSHQTYADLGEFEQAASSGELAQRIEQILQQTRSR